MADPGPISIPAAQLHRNGPEPGQTGRGPSLEGAGSLTVFSQTGRTALDYGTYSGHLTGCWPADTDCSALAGHFPLVYGSDAPRGKRVLVTWDICGVDRNRPTRIQASPQVTGRDQLEAWRSVKPSAQPTLVGSNHATWRAVAAAASWIYRAFSAGSEWSQSEQRTDARDHGNGLIEHHMVPGGGDLDHRSDAA